MATPKNIIDKVRLQIQSKVSKGDFRKNHLRQHKLSDKSQSSKWRVLRLLSVPTGLRSHQRLLNVQNEND